MIFSGDYSYELDNVERSGERAGEKKRERKQTNKKECRPRGSGGRKQGGCAGRVRMMMMRTRAVVGMRCRGVAPQQVKNTATTSCASVRCARRGRAGTAFAAPEFVASSRRANAVVTAASSGNIGAELEVDDMLVERLRLHNLSPFPGSTKNKKRVGRGYGAGQGGSCGRGMRGQKSRSGRGIRPGFEGGQSPLYRRIGKLKGIAGNNKKGQDEYSVLNILDLEENFAEDEEVSRESLVAKGLLATSGKKSKRPVKILGEGELSRKLNIKVSAVSASAKEKLEAAGCSVEMVKGPEKWTRALHKERLAAKSE